MDYDLLPMKVEMMGDVRGVLKDAFDDSLDGDIERWLSFEYMTEMIEAGRGCGVVAMDDAGEMVGAIYAQQENPVNASEGEDKWTVIALGVRPAVSGRGIGSRLVVEQEKKAKELGAKRMFVFTNEYRDDEKKFYYKNGYEDAGMVKDYHGPGDSAVWLLKYL